MSRTEILADLRAAGCTPIGFDLNTDDAVERAWLAWNAAGRPAGRVGVEWGREGILAALPTLTDLD